MIQGCGHASFLGAACAFDSEPAGLRLLPVLVWSRWNGHRAWDRLFAVAAAMVVACASVSGAFAGNPVMKSELPKLGNSEVGIPWNISATELQKLVPSARRIGITGTVGPTMKTRVAGQEATIFYALRDDKLMATEVLISLPSQSALPIEVYRELYDGFREACGHPASDNTPVNTLSPQAAEALVSEIAQADVSLEARWNCGDTNVHLVLQGASEEHRLLVVISYRPSRS